MSIRNQNPQAKRPTAYFPRLLSSDSSLPTTYCLLSPPTAYSLCLLSFSAYCLLPTLSAYLN